MPVPVLRALSPSFDHVQDVLVLYSYSTRDLSCVKSRSLETTSALTVALDRPVVLQDLPLVYQPLLISSCVALARDFLLELTNSC